MSIFQLVATTKTVAPGSQTYATPGSFTFSVPSYNTITIEVWGGGGGGSFYNLGTQANGGNGNTSTAVIAQGTLTSTGGQGGLLWNGPSSVGGTGSGPVGSTTASGGTSAQAQPYPTGGAGGGPGGGAGGYYLTNGGRGGTPGGGGAGYSTLSPSGNFRSASGGGGGGYVSYTTTEYIGATISLTVAAGGDGASGVPDADGGPGTVKITWS
jgi:hypothetical protein